jgi:hypothetical protein
MFAVCQRRYKYQSLCHAVLGYISMTEEVNIKLVELRELPIFMTYRLWLFNKGQN